MIEQVNSNVDFSKITPDFIYNRVDLFCENYIVLHVQNDKDYYLEVQLFDNHAELGIWMMEISGHEFDEISKFIFNKYEGIEYISFYNAITDRLYKAEKHYHIHLQTTVEELRGRVSSKSRNTMNRKRKKAEVDYGAISLIEYEGDEITDDIVNIYFNMKERTHHIRYNLTCQGYLDKYHVSNVYILYFGKFVAAIILTCEQCPIVYLENLTYDVNFSRFSPGLLAYEMVLEKLILKGKNCFYLGGGDYDYKKKYNSIETDVIEGRMYRSTLIKIKYYSLDYYNKHICWKVKKIKGYLHL